MEPIKVVITGAAGQIGYQLIYRIASGEVFGPDQPLILQLLELEAAMPALKGVVMEIDDCASSLVHDIVYTSDLKEAFNGADYAFLVGSVPRKAGMERADLLSINAGVFIDQGRAINQYASRDVKVLVVGNPCNTNCLIAASTASDLSPHQFFAMTLLDEYRATTQLARKANVHHSKIENCIIFGNHSSTLFPDYWHTLVDGKPIVDLIKSPKWFEEEFISTIQGRGAAIIQARGASSAASAANAAVGTMKKIVMGSETPFSVAIYSQGEYGSTPGTYVSMPCTSVDGKVTPITDWKHNPLAQDRMKATFEELEKERQTLRALGLLND
tara:strand:+ start:295 stop:1278 length:984 start_codon:yes stop_codon:yes gene_type:complete